MFPYIYITWKESSFIQFEYSQKDILHSQNESTRFILVDIFCEKIYIFYTRSLWGDVPKKIYGAKMQEKPETVK